MTANPYPADPQLTDPRQLTARVSLAPDDALPAELTTTTTTAGLQLLVLRVGPVVLELHDRAGLYALEELVQLAMARSAELWEECRGCDVRDSLVRDSWHDYCREEAARWPRPQLRPL